jgi:hypothetical protein
MRFVTLVATLVGVALAVPFDIRDSKTSSGFTIVHPGTVKNVKVTKDNTLNGTYHGPGTTTVHRKINSRAASGNLPLEFVNNFSGGQVNAYIQGLDSDNKIVFVLGDGSLIYPSSGGSAVPVAITQNLAIPLPDKGNTFKVTLPIVLTSGRIYFAEGQLSFFMVKAGSGDGLVQPSVSNTQDPSSGLNWGFVELSYTTALAVWANISYVDFVGMILSMALSAKDGSATQITRGLDSGAVSQICNGLVDQTNAEGYPWSSSCVANSSGNLLRVLSPGQYGVLNPSAFANYWNTYADQVWSKYTSAPLTINTQSGPGNVQCQVSGSTLTCAGDNRGYAKPTAGDIWGCNSGPFAIQGGDNAVHYAVVPRLCAAFVRSTLLLAGGNVQPSLDSSRYYTVNPTNHYSRLVHKYEVDGRGYSFAYDDVNPDGNENASGTISSGSPDTLTVYVGAPPA